MTEHTNEIERPKAPTHSACETLTGIAYERLPKDGRLGQLRRYRRGAAVWGPEDRTDRIFFVRRGEVAIAAALARGQEVTLRVARAGEPFGEMCHCSEREGMRRSTARAVVGTEVVEIEYDRFLGFLQSDRTALEEFVVTFCARLGEAERRIAVLAHRGAIDRIGRLLLQLASARRAGPEGDTLLRISHEEIARMAAMNRSHVSVTMGKLRELGLVTYGRNTPLRVHSEALEAYLQESRQQTVHSKQ